MTDRVAKPRARKKKPITKPAAAYTKALPLRRDSPHHSESSEGSSPTSVVSAASDGTWPVEAEQAIAAIRYQYRVPTLVQPSKAQADALDVAFMSHFVQLNQSSRSYTPELPWLTHLPTLYTNSVKPAVRLSVRAASMAFFAKVHNDPTVLVDSYRWYTLSLNAQRMSLARLGGQRIPDDEEILVPIILGLYEVYAGTTSHSVLLHVAAACEIIKMRGPSNCRSGVVWPLFKAMRSSDVGRSCRNVRPSYSRRQAQKALIFNQPSVFASPDWMTLPFVNMSRNAHIGLSDIMLQIPGCIGMCGVKGSLRKFFATPIPPGTNLQPCRERANQLIAELNRWAETYPYLATLADVSIKSEPSTEPSSTEVIIQKPRTNTAMLPPDSFIALTVATYEAVRLPLTLLLYKLSTEDTASPHSPTASALYDLAAASARALLQTTSCLESTKSVGFDFIRTVTPVVVVAILGPQPEQIAQARSW
jgi:hypothetical protein